jgi:hypothetical protein
MSVTVEQWIAISDLLIKVGAQVVERRRQRPIAQLSPAEIRLAAHEALAEHEAWDAPIEPIGEDAED